MFGFPFLSSADVDSVYVLMQIRMFFVQTGYFCQVTGERHKVLTI